MGEARRRKLAAAAGRPWERDAPPPPEPHPWYMDPMCPQLPRLPAPPAVIIAPSDQEVQRDLDAMRRAVEARGLGNQVLVIGDDPRDPLPLARGRRRPGGMELALIMAALGVDSTAGSLIAPPGGRGPKR
jgi:hypothetical protein